MFCEKCGTKLSDNAIFCENCGNKISGELNSNETLKIPDDVVQLRVKPTYKFFYMMSSTLIVFIILLLIFVLPLMAVDGTIGLILALILILGFTLIIAVKALINKKQYDSYEYCFYKTKVSYRDSFLNLAEKEVKYKYIREITMRQTFIQRFFNLGTILLFTNAETGFGNGIAIVNIENVKDIYKQIKDLLDI